MDETKNPSLDEMLDQPKLRTAEAMKTEDDKHAEAEAEDLIDRLKKGRGRHPHNVQTPPREEAYPELAKGKLLFQCEEYEAPKEYITLSMKEDKGLIKKILDQKGCLTGHPEIPVNPFEWDLPDLDCITKAINEEFPDAKLVAEKGDRVAELIGKYMGNVHVEFTCTGKLLVRGTETKFRMRDVHAAVKALAVVIPASKAEKIVAKEIAGMISNVL